MSKWFILFLVLMLSSQVLAHGEDKGISGEVVKHDWVNRLPLAVICILIVIAVDALFVIPIVRKLRAGEGIAAGQER